MISRKYQLNKISNINTKMKYKEAKRTFWTKHFVRQKKVLKKLISLLNQ